MRYLETRGLEVRSSGGQKRIGGLAAVYYDGTPATEYNIRNTPLVERVLPGAFTRSLERGDVKALYNHDTARVLGSMEAGTLRLTDTRAGLAFEVDMPNHASDVLEMVERGDVDGASFGFNVPEGGSELEREGGQIIRSLTDVDLREVTATAFPAYQATSGTVAIRCLGEPDLALTHQLREHRARLLRKSKLSFLIDNLSRLG